VLGKLANVLSGAVLQIHLDARGESETGNFGQVEAKRLGLPHGEELPVQSCGDGIEERRVSSARPKASGSRRSLRRWSNWTG
jgi:hypothetical protein